MACVRGKIQRTALFCAIGVVFLLISNLQLVASNEVADGTKEELRTPSEVVAQMLPPELVEELPTVLVVLLVRNKAHVLPLFFTYFEKLNYPKDRMALWVRSDHNNDSSVELLELWLNRTSDLYHSVNVELERDVHSYENESSQNDWPAARFSHLIKLKEEAYAYGQKIWADFIFYLDVDVFLTSPETLKHLTALRLPVVAPMLFSEGLYSNFWCGMSDTYYYERTAEYKEIYNVQKEGTFQVRMVHSAVLVYLNHKASHYLTFDRERLIAQQNNGEGMHCSPYEGPMDDIIVFAMSANCSQIPLFVNNELTFGYIMPPVDDEDTWERDLQQIMNVRTNIVHDFGAVEAVPDYLIPYMKHPIKQNLTVDRIFMINLERRPERRNKMQTLFHELGLIVDLFPAVDGQTLDAATIEQMGIKFLPGYEDPYHLRQMTMGEIGCFLSHYRIWEKVVEENLNEVLIIEDDLRFEPYFRNRFEHVLEQARRVGDFDLIYIGRKRLKDALEPTIQGAEQLVLVGYSYWTLGYVLSLRGAKKLLAAKPLEKLLPVDEFLPIMFNRHPNETWSEAFPERDLAAFSANPLLVFPTHYTGDVGYISDTEHSDLTTQRLGESSAQLKSDRELDFSQGAYVEFPPLPQATIEPKLQEPDIKGLGDFADVNVGKSHEEF